MSTLPPTGEYLTHRYKFGFILSTSLGNLTRYRNLRRFAERDHEVDFTWAPVKHYFGPDERNRFAWLPGFLQSRAIVLYQAWPVLRRFARFDAVMIHMFEVDVLTSVRSYFSKAPLRVLSSDDAPAIDAAYPLHPVDQKKPAWRRAIRLKLDIWRARRADLLLPFSDWAGRILQQEVGIRAEKVVPLHVGLDLDVWQFEPKPAIAVGQRIKLLFVGGEFDRKGGNHLLEAFVRDLQEIAEVHLVTRSAPDVLPANVHVYADLTPDDPRLAQLYRDADVLVHPTTSDLSPWVVLEAMASGLPVVVTPVGSIGDWVEQGATGLFVRVGDVDALSAAIRTLASDPTRLRRMGEAGRRFIESNFDAAVNVPKILEVMKAAVRSQRRR